MELFVMDLFGKIVDRVMNGSVDTNMNSAVNGLL